MEATHDSISGAQQAASTPTPPNPPWQPVQAGAGARSREERLADTLELVDAIVQENVDQIEALLDSALAALQADPMGNAWRLRRLLQTARRLALDMQNTVNCEAEQMGANYKDELEASFSEAIFKLSDAQRADAQKAVLAELQRGQPA
jgi:hypothetical protein